MSTEPEYAFDSVEDLEFVNEEERAYFAEAKLGHEIWEWLRSPAGRYLRGRAKILVDESSVALMALDLTDPENLKRAQKLQFDARIGEQFLRWCVEALENGRNAEFSLESFRDQE